MSDTLQALRRKIHGATELYSVVRTMKSISAASITQYERAVSSLADYCRTVELGLRACLRQDEFTANQEPGLGRNMQATHAVVFGSDQGLVGQFNEMMADFVVAQLASMPGKKCILAVGERIRTRLAEAGAEVAESFALPASVNGITPLISSILLASEARRAGKEDAQLFLFHHQPKSGAIYLPVIQRLLPLNAEWCRGIASFDWPTKELPEVFGPVTQTLEMMIREYVFVSLFKTCAESLASENAARLTAMRRAEKNIDQLQEELGRAFHQMRQNTIDDELFDLVSGFEALTKEKHNRGEQDHTALETRQTSPKAL